MFFNHDFVSSRKAGLRIVWLASTLGSASRRLTKRDFTTVDVPKTCKDLANPSQPLALRTSGHLLYGAARIYTKQAEYWMNDVQTHYSAVRKLLSEGGGSTKQLGGLVIVGNDTSTIDMPGRGRTNHDAVTLPSRFDFFASHTNIDFQWSTNDAVGDSDVFMASLASVYGGSQRSPAPSVEFGLGMPSSSSARGKYTLDPSEIRRLPSTSSPMADMAPFNLEALLPDMQGGEGIDLGLDTAMEGDIAPMNELNDFGFDMQQPDWIVEEDQAGLFDQLPASRRERSSSADYVPAERPAKRARFALADSSTELSYEAVLSWRDCYVSDMVELREKEAERQMMRKGAQEGIRLAFAPGLDFALAGPLVKMWEDSVAASKMALELRAAVVEDPGIGRNEPVADADAQLMPWQDDYDMPQWNDPGLPSGGMQTSTPQYGSEVARGTQGSSQKQTDLPWNQPLGRKQAADTTMGGDTTSVHSARSFMVETPTGLRRRSVRQSSIGAASIGEGAVDEDLLAVPPRPSLPANSQEIADVQVANFFSYVNRVRAQLPDEQPLFFSDLAPIADSTPFVAASAFYNTLALATAKMLKVGQAVPYAEIKIDIAVV